MKAGGRRRIDRILDPSYVEGLDRLPLAELRRRRQETQEEGDELDDLRSRLHGKLDIIRAEVERRRTQGGSEGRLPYDLARVLARPAAPRRGAWVRLPRRRDRRLARELERVASEAHLVRLPEMSDEELAELVARVEAAERRVSEQRRSVLAVRDALEGELIRRYKTGEASPDDLLRGRVE